MPSQIHLVEYLEFGDDPHVIASECTVCGARFFDRRNARGSCFGTGVSDCSRSRQRANCEVHRAGRSSGRMPNISNSSSAYPPADDDVDAAEGDMVEDRPVFGDPERMVE